jgi:NO-binding membrane sensor protein with MHYT domain
MLLVLFVGMFAVALPFVAMAVLACYVLSARAADDEDSRTVIRETGALAIAPLIGFGIWTGVLVLGVDIGVVPFLGWADGYDYTDDWGALSVLVAVAATTTAWWLLRRSVDQVGRQ